MRRPLLLASVVLALAACDGGGSSAEPPTPSPVPTTTSPSPTTPSPTPTEQPSPSARPIPPAWAAPIEQDLAPEDVADADLVPPDAQLADRVTLPAAGGAPDQIAVAYTIGDDPFVAEHGFALWQRFAETPAWSVVLAFDDAPSEGVLVIRIETGDLTGDGHDDALTSEQTGGSGACARWRVVATTAGGAAQVFSKRTCDTQVRIAAGALEVRQAVYEPGDAHCCPSSFRTSTLEWNGERFVRTDVREEPAG